MRARNIKPDFFRDYELSQLDIWARMLFCGLWCAADREGRLEYCPPRIRADIFPYDSVDVEKLLESLGTHGFIIIYTAGEQKKKYIQIPGFHKHQNPHKNEKPSVFPPVEGCRVITGVTPEITGAAPADSLIEDSLIPDSLIEDKAEKTPPSPPPKTKKFIQPNLEAVLAYCQERGNSVDAQRWMDHYISNGWMVGRTKMQDWKATVRNWERGSGTNTPATVHPIKKTAAEEELARRLALSCKLMDELGPEGYDAYIVEEDKKRRGIA